MSYEALYNTQYEAHKKNCLDCSYVDRGLGTLWTRCPEGKELVGMAEWERACRLLAESTRRHDWGCLKNHKIGGCTCTNKD